MTQNNNSENWLRSSLQVFWGEIAPCDHVVQIYKNEKVFLDTLEGFIGSGLIAGDSVIIIATEEHHMALEDRLVRQGFDLSLLKATDRYIGVEVREALSRFMVNKWPDEKLFMEFVTSLLNRAQCGNRNIRAFGEMVAMLWQQGFNGATVQLEFLWNKLHQNEKLTLFCAYPKIGFTQDINNSIDTICSAHTKVIDGNPNPSTEIHYKTTG